MEEEFKEYVGGNLKDFTVLDAFDSLFLNGKANQEAQNPSKYLLYQDPMAGTFDREVVESGVGTGAYYEKLKKMMEICQENSPEYAALFAYYEKLAAVLADKADLGVRMKAAYDKKQLLALKEICEKAGVNRSTFYLHYETIGDLLSESIQYMNEQFVSYMQQDPAAFIARLRHCPLEELYLLTPQYLMPYLQYVQMHKYLFKAAIENGAALQVQEAYDAQFRHVLSPILERFNIPEQERPYMTAFYVRGLMAIVTQWLEEDCARPIEQIIAVMQRCVHLRSLTSFSIPLFCDPAGTCE